MTEMMSHHEMMDDSHDCCLSEATHHHPNAEKNTHDCENGVICACPMDEVPVKDQATVPAFGSSAVILSQTGFNFMVTSPDEFIYEDYFAEALEHAPPLYLQYDTFLN